MFVKLIMEVPRDLVKFAQKALGLPTHATKQVAGAKEVQRSNKRFCIIGRQAFAYRLHSEAAKCLP